jgi:Fe2+ or Zn2+ uptake regulation protein
MNDHPSADAVYAKIHGEYPSISRATVYRDLEYLSVNGQILHVQMPSGADCYDFNIHDHYHIRCEKCRRVFDICVPLSTRMLDGITDSDGFLITKCNVTFSGICPECNDTDEGGKCDE